MFPRRRAVGDLSAAVRLAITPSGASSPPVRPGRRNRRYPERSDPHFWLLLRKPSIEQPET